MSLYAFWPSHASLSLVDVSTFAMWYINLRVERPLGHEAEIWPSLFVFCTAYLWKSTSPVFARVLVIEVSSEPSLLDTNSKPFVGGRHDGSTQRCHRGDDQGVSRSRWCATDCKLSCNDVWSYDHIPCRLPKAHASLGCELTDVAYQLDRSGLPPSHTLESRARAWLGRSLCIPGSGIQSGVCDCVPYR